MNNTEHIRSYSKGIHFLLYALTVLMPLVIGVFLSWRAYQHWPLIVSLSVIYIAVLVADFKILRIFPSVAFDELEAQQRVAELEKEVTRNQNTYDSLANSIRDLNILTCEASTDSNFQKELEKILTPLIYNFNSIFCTCSQHISCGVYFNENVPRLWPQGCATFEEESIILKDEHGLKRNFPDSLTEMSKMVGLPFDLLRIIQKTMNTATTQFDKFDHDGTLLVTTSIPIPEICNENTAQGAIFMIADNCQRCELSSHRKLFEIYGKLVSNYLHAIKGIQCHIENLQEYNNPDEAPGPGLP